MNITSYKPNEGIFTQFWSQMYFGLLCWLDFGIKGQRSRLQQAMTCKTGWIHYLRKYLS